MQCKDQRVRHIVITGASQGIGRGLAAHFLSQGDAVVSLDLHAGPDDTIAADPNFRSILCDVTEPESIHVALDTLGWSKIDVLVNCASIFSTLTMQPFWQIAPAEWRRVVDVNLNGSFFVTVAALDYLKASSAGRVIHFSSAVVPMGRPNYLHYVSSKAGIVGMTRAMARELGALNITVNAVLPGATVTEIERDTVSPEQMQAMISARSIARAQRVDDVTGVVAFLASDAARFMTGQALVVDGGLVFNGA
jgi:3-oxoacyl-[acyl-carrier protein] reductase